MESKAIKFKLLPLTKNKEDCLLAMSDNFKEIYNFAAMRLPSLQTVSQSKSRIAIEAIRKDIKSSTKLHSQIAQEAIEYARSNYLTILAQEENNIPVLTKNIIRIHNQAWDFEIKNNRIYVVVPFQKVGNRFSKLWLPVKTSEHYTELLNTNKKFGVGQIDIDSQTFITTIQHEVPESKTVHAPETFIGIDLGLNNLATLAVIDINKKVVKTKFWNGNETRHIRNRFNNYRTEVSKIGCMDKLQDSKGYEQRWMQNVNHNISKEVIEISKQYPHPIIIMENLHKFTNLRWNFFQLRQMIEYKAIFNGIQTQLIDAKYTSQKCNKCGHTEKANRNGLDFKCIKCSYQLHADLNAAINIAGD